MLNLCVEFVVWSERSVEGQNTPALVWFDVFGVVCVSGYFVVYGCDFACLVICVDGCYLLCPNERKEANERQGLWVFHIYVMI